MEPNEFYKKFQCSEVTRKIFDFGYNHCTVLPILKTTTSEYFSKSFETLLDAVPFKFLDDEFFKIAFLKTNFNQSMISCKLSNI